MGSVDRTSGPRKLESRRTPRVGVELWVEEHCGVGIYYHRMTNLSPGGFFVEKRLPFRVGQVVTIRLDLPDEGTQLQARSRVVANHRDDQANFLGAGFQFLELDADARKSIAALIAKAHSRERRNAR